MESPWHAGAVNLRDLSSSGPSASVRASPRKPSVGVRFVGGAALVKTEEFAEAGRRWRVTLNKGDVFARGPWSIRM